jgi:hypothetical protein
MNQKPGNLKMMLLLWAFAIGLAGTVIWLMILRGPAVMP